MAQGKNSITLANVISTIGIVLLMVVLFLGHFYSGDNIGIGILKTAGWGALFTFLLWFMIKAKTAEEDQTKWLVIELVTLFIYLVAAGISSPKTARFATIYKSASELKASAHSDIEAIRQTIDKFKTEEHLALTNTVLGLQHASTHDVSQALTDFVAENNFELNEQSIAIFQEKWAGIIDNVTDSTLSSWDEPWQAELDRCDELIQGWNVLKIPGAVRSMSDFDVQVSEKLQEVSASLPLPNINCREDSTTFDIVARHVTKTYPIETRFVKDMADMSSYSIIGLLIFFILHIMILFSYLVAYRTKKRRPTKNDYLFNDKGMNINI